MVKPMHNHKCSEKKQQKYISDLRRNLIIWKLGNTIKIQEEIQWKKNRPSGRMAKRIQAIVGGTALATAAIAGYVFANR